MNTFQALIAAAENAQCACSLRERESGHLVGCWRPDLSEAIAHAKVELGTRDDARVERIQPIADPRGIVSGNTLTLDVEPVVQSPALGDDIRTLLRGFEEGAFVRDASRDGEPGWAIRILPFLAALGRLANAAREDEPPKMGMQGWIPVSERLPEEEEYVLVRVAASPIDMPTPWIGEGRYAEDEFDEVMRWSVAGPLGWAHPVNVTHWMPKPIAPGVTSGVGRP